MEEKKIKIFGESDCYGLTKDLSFTLRLTYTFIDDIDKEAIIGAVRDLEKRFSYLKLTLKKNFKEFYYVSNIRPFVVKETDKAIPLNGEESNYHLLAFSYYGKRLYINAYHGQMDGTGLYRLGKALIYYYCLRRYSKDIKVEDVALLDEVVEEEEYRDAYKHFYLTNKKTKFGKETPQKPIKNIMVLTGLKKVKPGRRTAMKIVIPQKDLMDYCSSFDGSPVTSIALMMANAIRNVHPTSKKKVVIGIPVNLRPAMGLKKSHCNLFSKIHFEYSKKLSEQEFKRQGTICRGIIIRYSDHDLLRKNIYRYTKMLAALNLIPIRKLKQVAANIVAKKMKTCESADVTYVGRCLYGDMEQYIESMYLDVDCNGLGLMASLSAIGDKFFISINQDWEDRIYLDAFLKVLEKRGISYRIDSFGLLDTSKMENVF